MLNRLIVIFLIICASVGYSLYQKRSFEAQISTSSESILTKLPDGIFETLDGNPFSTYDLFKDSPSLVVVHFWGTWCAPCEAELPELLTFIKRFEQSQVKFLLVAVNDDKVKVQKHLKTLAIPKSSIVWLLDNKNIHRDLYGTTRVPETYVFSSNKLMLKKYLGPQEWNKSMFFQAFDEFVKISTSRL